MVTPVCDSILCTLAMSSYTQVQDSMTNGNSIENNTPPQTPSPERNFHTVKVDPLESYRPHDTSDIATYDGLPYVRLNEDYNHLLCWSNDPKQLYLATYFNPNHQMNLSNEGQGTLSNCQRGG